MNLRSRKALVEIKNSSTARKEELDRYQILDGCLDVELDELCRLAANICNTPIALVSLLDDEQQWFIAKYGTDLTSTPIDISFCRLALKTPTELFIVKDATQEERFKSNPLVLGSPHIKFYAGAPLISPNKVAIGTLCVISSEAMDLDDNQKAALKILSRRIYASHRLEIDHQRATKKFGGFCKKTSKDYRLCAQHTFWIPIWWWQPNCNRIYFERSGAYYPRKNTWGCDSWFNLFFRVSHNRRFYAAPGARLRSKSSTRTPGHLCFPVNFSDGTQLWFEMKASPEPDAGGSIHWYGAVHDVTAQVEYEKVLEDIAFDISHVLRRPVSTYLGVARFNTGELGIGPRTTALLCR